jgi:translation initiation factor IF-3
MSKDKRLNEEITARQITVIGEEGEQFGTLSRDEALSFAAEKELDLVEVGERDGVAIAKLMDYGKHLFRQQKSQNKNRSSSKKAEMKTLKITYKISDHDLDVRANQAKKFAEHRHPLKVMLQLRGRENQFVDIASAKMHDFIAKISEFYKIEGSVKKIGTAFHAMLNPKN